MEKQNSNKKKIGTLAGIIFGLILAYMINHFLFAPPSFDKVLMQTASKLSESCPVMIDQVTRLDNVAALPGNIIQYNYTLVNWAKDSINIKSFEEYLQPMILNNVKTNPDLKTFRENKTTMAYYYRDMNGEFVAKISITSDQYLEGK
ncbi:hypothetical protein SDC9_143030 [bioreactor metagenome]|uniref:Uncharacterized protein n=1 Tax=bioreactor metagenome TaxID=1076179 RepID=A0A645E256_9ZZZZ|nr:hypothetical protein [Paludibacter sp.]